MTAVFVLCAAEYSKLHLESPESMPQMANISPSPDELLAAYDAFGELPGIEALARLLMIRRAVAVGFYNDDLPQAEQSSLSVTLPVA